MTEFFDWKTLKRQDCLLLNFGLPDLPSVPFPQLRRVILRVISIIYIDLLFLIPMGSGQSIIFLLDSL